MEILKKGQYIENKYTGEKLLLYRLVSVFKGFGCEIEFVGSDYLFYNEHRDTYKQFNYRQLVKMLSSDWLILN
jgi:hypothetical protein